MYYSKTQCNRITHIYVSVVTFFILLLPTLFDTYIYRTICIYIDIFKGNFVSAKKKKERTKRGNVVKIFKHNHGVGVKRLRSKLSDSE